MKRRTLSFKRLRIGAAIRSMAVFFILCASISCTRSGSNSSTSSFSLQLPDFAHFRGADFGARATTPTYALNRVMINVTGPGIVTPVVSIWDSGQAGAAAAPPGNFSFTVPSGNGYLVQVLAILQPASSGGGSSAMTILYGDATQNFTSGTVAVDVSLAQIGSTLVTSAQGQIAGRWLSGANSGPTGRVNITYSPGGGKPAMIVTQNEIHGGWFSWPAFEGLNFSYVFEDGTPLITNFNLDQTVLLSGAANNMLVTVPGHYQQNNGSTYMPTSPWILQLGFFGPAAAGNVVCYDSNSANSMKNVSADSSGTAMPWAGGSIPSASQAGVRMGGQASPGANCQAPASLYASWLRFDQTSVNDPSGGVLGFQGPFVQAPPLGGGSGNALAILPSGSGLGLTWNYMPGTTGAGRVSAVGLFVRDLPSAPTNGGGGHQDYSSDNGVACNRLTDSSFIAQPFTLVSNIPVQNSGVGPQSFTLNGYPVADLFSGKLQVILCPFSSAANAYFSSAAVYNSNQSAAMPQVTISGEQSVPMSVCSPLTLNYSINNQPAPAPAGTTVALSSSGSGMTTGFGFYNDSACASVMSTAQQNGKNSFIFNFPSGAQTATVFYKDTISAPGQRTLQAMASSLTGSGYSNGFSPSFPVAIGLPATTPSTYSLMASSSFVLQGQCIPINFSFNAGTQFANNSARSATFGDSSGSGGFYSDAACTQSVPGNMMLFSAAQFFRTVYFRSSAAPGSYSINAGGTGLTGSTLNYTLDSPAVKSAKLSMQSMSGPSSYYAPGACIPVNISTYALNQESTTVQSAVSATVSSGSAALSFSPSSDCSGAASTITIPLGPATAQNPSGSSPTFYAVTSANANATVSSSISIPSLGVTAANSTTNFYQQPDSFSVFGTPTGNQLMQDYCQPVSLMPQWSGGAFPGTGYLPAMMTVGASVISGAGGIYMDSMCSSPLSPGFNLSSGVASTPFYVRSISISPLTLSIGGANSGVSTTPLTVNFSSTAVPAGLGITITTGTYATSTCAQVTFALPFAVTDSAGVGLSLYMQSLTNMYNNNYYTSAANCSSITGGTTFTSIPVGQSSVSMWVRFGTISTTTVPQFQALANSFNYPGILGTVVPMTSCNGSTSCTQ